MIKPTRAEYLPNRAGDQSYRESLDAFLLHRYREALEKIANPADGARWCACYGMPDVGCAHDIARKALEDSE